MNDQQYLEHCQQVFAEFCKDLTTRTSFLPENDSLRELAEAFEELTSVAGGLYRDGPGLISRLFTTYPDFAPLVPRELLWFLGGECLHYMPDDEISLYQQLADLRAEAAARGEILDLKAARVKLLKLQ